MVSSQSSELQFSLMTEVRRPHSRIDTPLASAIFSRCASPASCLNEATGLHHGDSGVAAVTAPCARLLKPLNL